MFKKNLAAFLIMLMFAFGGSALVFNFVQADDDEEQEEGDEEDNEDEDRVENKPEEDDSSDDEEEEVKTYKETVVVEPAKTITENLISTTYLPDRDRDGIADNEDPHPDIAEIYIVIDDDLNGIVDTFEYGT